MYRRFEYKDKRRFIYTRSLQLTDEEINKIGKLSLGEGDSIPSKKFPKDCFWMLAEEVFYPDKNISISLNGNYEPKSNKFRVYIGFLGGYIIFDYRLDKKNHPNVNFASIFSKTNKFLGHKQVNSKKDIGKYISELGSFCKLPKLLLLDIKNLFDKQGCKIGDILPCYTSNRRVEYIAQTMKGIRFSEKELGTRPADSTWVEIEGRKPPKGKFNFSLSI